jgi:hypothetical protein
MEISELSKLISLYVTGSLTEQERRTVEEALAGSDELRKEIEFWKLAQHPARSYDPTHLSAEAIVSYAEGRIMGQERIALETHLQQCADCQHDLEIIRETYPTEESIVDEGRYPAEVRVPELFKEFFKTLKTVYPIPAAVLIVLCVLVLVLPLSHRKQNVPSVAVQTPPTQTRAVELFLEYSTQLRSSGTLQLPTLRIPTDTVRVTIVLSVPRSLDSVRYRIEVISPLGAAATVRDLVKPLPSGDGLDHLSVDMSSEFFQTEGEYRVRATEQLPVGVGLTPESHQYPFVVSLFPPRK